MCLLDGGLVSVVFLSWKQRSGCCLCVCDIKCKKCASPFLCNIKQGESKLHCQCLLLCVFEMLPALTTVKFVLWFSLLHNRKLRCWRWGLWERGMLRTQNYELPNVTSNGSQGCNKNGHSEHLRGFWFGNTSFRFTSSSSYVISNLVIFVMDDDIYYRQWKYSQPDGVLRGVGSLYELVSDCQPCLLFKHNEKSIQLHTPYVPFLNVTVDRTSLWFFLQKIYSVIMARYAKFQDISGGL